MNATIQTIKSRRSVRAYKPDKLKKADLAAIVEAGIYAPTAGNRQPWHFTVIQDRKQIGFFLETCWKALAAYDNERFRKIAADKVDVTYGAPAIIIVSALKGVDTGKPDATAALQNMMLAAESLGIGSCWMGMLSFSYGDEAAMRKLGVPEGYAPIDSSIFGYPAEGAKKEAPPRNPDVVTYIGNFD